MAMVLSLAFNSANAALVAHYTLDGNANDSVGTNHGTVYGGAQWTIGVFGEALNFDGDNDYVEVADDDALDFGLSQDFSIALWFRRIGGASPPDAPHIINKRTPTNPSIGYQLFYGDRAVHSYYRKVGFLIVVGTPKPKVVSTTNIDDGLWHHVVGLRQGDILKLYVDGIQEGGDVSGTEYDADLSNTNPLRLGINSAFTHNKWHHGNIDDVRLYNHALTEEEISALLGKQVEVDINPGSCPNPVNVKSRGVLPVAILGTADVNVLDIDPASIELAGVGAIRSSYEDVAGPIANANECNCIETGPDGYTDLTLKFETEKIVEAIGEVNNGDVLTLKLTGSLFCETPINGTDCVVIVGRFKPLNKADFNRDKKVDMADFAEFAENWMESIED